MTGQMLNVVVVLDVADKTKTRFRSEPGAAASSEWAERLISMYMDLNPLTLSGASVAC